MAETAVLIPGDGIGPEVTEAVKRIFSAAGVQVDWVERFAGVAALERGSDTVLPHETMDAIRTHGVALKGPCTTPIGGGFSSMEDIFASFGDIFATLLSSLPSRYSRCFPHS